MAHQSARHTQDFVSQGKSGAEFDRRTGKSIKGPREARGWKSPHSEAHAMCRNIKTLYNFEPPATHDEIRAAAL